MKQTKKILNALIAGGLFIFGTVTLHAQQNSSNPLAGSAGAKKLIISSAQNTGSMYQFIERCGASQQLLTDYKASFDADTAGGEKTYRDLEIDIQAEFEKGRKEGENEYAKIADVSNREQICKQAIETVTKLIDKSK